MTTKALTVELLDKLPPDEQEKALAYVRALLAHHEAATAEKPKFDPRKYYGALQGTTMVEDVIAMRDEWDRKID